MGYTLGLSGIDKADYSVTGYGTVKSFESTSARTWFVKLQKVVNRFSKVAGFSKFTPDGDLGPTTTAAVKKAAAYAISRMGAESLFAPARDASSGKDYAPIADNLARGFETVANSLSLPAETSGGGGGGWTPSPSTDPGAAPVSTGPGFFDQITSMQIAGLPLLPVLGIAALIYFKKKGKKAA